MLQGVSNTLTRTEASDGNFYGTTTAGGSGNNGTVFRMTSSGNVTTMHTFPSDGSEGRGSFCRLVQGADGSLYGTTSGGSFPNSGIIFKMTLGGTFTTLHSFTGTTVPSPGNDGATPLAGLVQATDGNFYGTTSRGGAGAGAAGTVFKITSGGNVTILYSFPATFGLSVPVRSTCSLPTILPREPFP
jgi:uncharacterized repeat protein (TIGR03803 family)